jgi:hypothetical protein
MYTEVSLDPKRCSFKVDQKAWNQWVSNHARQIGQLEDVSNPINITRDEAIEEKPIIEDISRADRQTKHVDLAPNGSGEEAPTGGIPAGTTAGGTTSVGSTPPTVITHLRFGTPDPPTIPLRARGHISKIGSHPSENKEANQAIEAVRPSAQEYS